MKTNIPVIPVRKLFNISLEEIKHLKHNLSLEFEDGVVKENLNYKLVIVFRYLMDILTKVPRIPIVSDYWIENFLVNGYFNTSTYTKIYSAVFKDFVNIHVKPTNNINLLDDLFKAMYETINNIPKQLGSVLGHYLFGVEIVDILKVQMKEPLLQSITEVYKKPSQEKILNTYDVLDKVIKELDDSNIIKLIYLSDMVSKSQLRQLFGSRGYLTEINSEIFKVPMMNSFTLGFRNIYDAAIESRAGAKALYLAIKAISSSELMARELQLVTMNVEKVVYGDCGSKHYVDFYVEPANENRPSDLAFIIGKRYYNEETGMEEVITEQHTHLIGKTIKLRSALYCNHPDKKAICSACLGELAYSIRPRDNLGHVCSTNITKLITQSLLSAKHLTKSASTTAIVLKGITAKYLQVKNKNELYIQKRWLEKKTRKIRLIIPQTETYGFKNAIGMGDIRKITLSKVSRLNTIYIEEYDPKTNEGNIEPLKLKIDNRYGIFTVYFWDYVLKHGYDIDENDNYVVELDNWDPKKPIIYYEEKEFDFATLGSQFASLIKTRDYSIDRKTGKKIPKYKPEVLVEKILELLSHKIVVNIALVEVLVYAFTARDINNKDYDLSRNSKNMALINMTKAIDGRSFGAVAGWMKVQEKLHKPIFYKGTHKPDHPLDVLHTPNEVIRYVGER